MAKRPHIVNLADRMHRVRAFGYRIPSAVLQWEDPVRHFDMDVPFSLFDSTYQIRKTGSWLESYTKRVGSTRKVGYRSQLLSADPQIGSGLLGTALDECSAEPNANIVTTRRFASSAAELNRT